MAETTTTPKKKLNSLALVGFGALLIAGIFLAIYAARYIPETLSRLSSAVILSSDPEQNEETPADPTPTTPTRPTTPAATTTPTKPTTPTTPVIGYYPPVITQTTPNLYGQADLALVNVEAGYFRGNSFVEDNEVPDGRDAGIKFTVRNNGTNAAANWRVRVDVEGDDTAIGNGGYLLPNGYQNFTIRISDPKPNRSMEVEIDVDYQNNVAESNERNNDDSIELEIED